MKAYEFGDEISDDEIFEHLSNSKNDMKKDTKKNWADFDAYFDNYKSVEMHHFHQRLFKILIIKVMLETMTQL